MPTNVFKGSLNTISSLKEEKKMNLHMVITHTQNKRQNNNNYANERGKWEPVDVEGEFSVEESREVLSQGPNRIPQIYIVLLLVF